MKYESNFGFSFTYPRSWENKVIIEETDSQIVVDFKPSIQISEKIALLPALIPTLIPTLLNVG